jgi:hypothetical protein
LKLRAPKYRYKIAGMVHPTPDLDRILAFRLNNHHLARRLPAGSLLQAAGPGGIQNTPPGTATLALNARITGLSTNEMEQALTVQKTLMQAWSLRGAPYIFPARDAPVFTLSLSPATEEEIRAFIPGVTPALEKIGVSAREVIDLAGQALLELLDGRTLTKDELGVALARWCLPHLSATQRSAWGFPSWYARGQTLGESVARFALPVLSLQGLCCHAARREGKAYLVRTDQWIGPPPGEVDLDLARAELVSRYLRCYGPSTLLHFAEWAGISPTQASQSWKQVEPELVEINGSKPGWLLQRDYESWLDPPISAGIRFLPPHDPFLTLRDRESLIPDKSVQREIWKHAGNPGVLLVDGRVSGIWRKRQAGNRLYLTITQFTSLSQPVHSQIEGESAALASLHDCNAVQIDFRAGM